MNLTSHDSDPAFTRYHHLQANLGYEKGNKIYVLSFTHISVLKGGLECWSDNRREFSSTCAGRDITLQTMRPVIPPPREDAGGPKERALSTRRDPKRRKESRGHRLNSAHDMLFSFIHKLQDKHARKGKAAAPSFSRVSPSYFCSWHNSVT